MTRSAADFEIPKHGASWRIVKFVRQRAATKQYPVPQRQYLRASPADRVCTFTAQRGHQLAEGTRAQGERGYPGGL